MIPLRRNLRHHKTQEVISESPVKADFRWDAVEALFLGPGAAVEEGRGSNARINLNDVVAVFHRPQPKRITD